MNALLSSDHGVTLLVGVLAGCVVSAVGWLLFQWTRSPRSEEADGAQDRPMFGIDPFVHGSTTERRTSLRRKGTQVEVLLRDCDGRRDLGRAWVIDRSMGGMCLALPDEMEPGHVLNVRPVNATPTVPWVSIEVKSCRHKDGKWELGCQFVRQPTWNVIMLFG